MQDPNTQRTLEEKKTSYLKSTSVKVFGFDETYLKIINSLLKKLIFRYIIPNGRYKKRNNRMSTHVSFLMLLYYGFTPVFKQTLKQ